MSCSQILGVEVPAETEIAKVNHQIGDGGTDIADDGVPVGLRLRGVLRQVSV